VWYSGRIQSQSALARGLAITKRGRAVLAALLMEKDE